MTTTARRILVVDNYDSFVFTIVGYLEQLGAECTVVRNDAVAPADAADFESLPLPGGIEYLLNGAVAGSPDEVMAFTRRLSAVLAAAKVEHTFDVHDGKRIVLTLPE